MHYGEMPRATLGTSDLRSQLAIFGEWNIYGTRKKKLLNFKPVTTAGYRHKQNSWFCKEIREDNFRCWWRRVHEDASQGMYMYIFVGGNFQMYS